MESEDAAETLGRTPGNSGRRRWRWAGLAAMLAVVLGLGLATLGGAWGGGSPKASSDSSSGSVSSSWSTANLLAYAECMRAHGVTDYPEPGGSGEDTTGTTVDRDSPAYQAAAQKCYRLMPGDPAATAHATQQQISKALQTAACMRDHGVSNFPDPIVTSKPPTFGNLGSGTAADNEMYSNGILFKFPSSIVSSPAYQAAAKACNLNNY